jgi:hypothetical protein
MIEKWDFQKAKVINELVEGGSLRRVEVAIGSVLRGSNEVQLWKEKLVFDHGYQGP